MSDLRKFFSPILLLLPAVILLALVFVVPSFDTLVRAVFDPDFTTEHFERIVSRGVYQSVLINTLQVSFVVALLCVLIGYPVAYFLATQPRDRQFLFLFLIFIPLWMSILVRTYAWMVVLGREGLVNAMLIALGVTDGPIKMLYVTPSVYLTMVQILLPIQIVTSFTAISEINFNIIRASRVLGASHWQSLRTILVPLSLEGSVNGFIIVFMMSMGFFITPALVGGRKDIMLGNLIEMNVARLNWGFAAAIAIVLLAATLLGVALIRMGAKYLQRVATGSTH